VVIFEDGRYDRLGMLTELAAEPDIELECATAQPQEVLTAIKSDCVDVVVADLRIYDDDTAGLALIKEIRHEAPTVKIIVLTALPELPNFLTAFGYGVEAFVKKAAAGPRPTLGDVIRQVAAGGRYYDPDMMRAMYQQMAEIRPRQEDDPPAIPAASEPHISERELEVLQLLAANRPTQQIADALVISASTVKTHIRNIIGKLGVAGRREAVLVAAARGLLNRKPR
jgi:DNA-binding NarL/FixJ family response regulator